MATFPTSLPTTSTIPVETASTALSTNHVASHQGAQDEIIALATKVGVNSSAVTTTHDYKLGEVTGSDKAVGKTATQTLTNKTITSPTITGATITTSSVNGVTIQTAGAASDFLAANGSYVAGGTANASTTVKGIVEAATSAEVTAGTATGGTGAVLAVTPDALAASTPVFNGSGLTALNNFNIYKNGVDSSRAGNAAASTQNIAHGCGKTPKFVKITASYGSGVNTTSSANYITQSFGSYNGTTNSCMYTAINGGSMYGGASLSSATYGVYLFTPLTISHGDYERAVITFDSTNIILTWTINNGLGSANAINIMWEAEA